MNAPLDLRVDTSARPLFRTPEPEAQPLALSHFRLMVALMLFGLATLLIAGRLVQLILFSGKGDGTGLVAEGPRGDIIDRNGLPLAVTIKAWSIAINPQAVLGDKAALAQKLAALLPEKNEAEYRRILFSKTKKFVWLKQNAVPALVARLHALGEPAILELSHPQRLYPQATLAGHVLGYAQMVEGAKGKEELTGIGVERFYDDQLRAGKTVQLSIDTRVQAALEGEIARRVAETTAQGGAGVVMDVDTGELVGLASLPSINPNAPLLSQADIPNKATLLTYELGSTFKMLTFANAIESGILTDMRQTWDVASALHIGGHTIHDDEPMHRPLTTPEVMTYSSNIGTARIADLLGADRIKDFFKRVGFYDRTSVETRERGMPQVPTYWARTTIMTTAFGHGIAVTPLHLAQAYAALANGGVMRQATLVKHQPGTPVAGTRVISEATSARMRQLMRLVVLQGTGTNANAAGLRVGGKTGTAEKVVGRGYSKSANITTFAGAFPMDHPRYVVLVMLDDAKAIKSAPGVQSTYGFKTAGWMTAPLAKRVIRRIGPLLNVMPDETQDVDVADLMALLAEKKEPGKNAID